MYLLTSRFTDGTLAIVGDGQRFEFPAADGPLLADLLDGMFPACMLCEDRDGVCDRCNTCEQCGTCPTCEPDPDDDPDSDGEDEPDGHHA